MADGAPGTPGNPIELPPIVVTPEEEPKPKKVEKGTGTGNNTGRVQGQSPQSAGSAAGSNPPVEPETPKEKGWLARNSGTIHNVLDTVSWVPGVGGAVGSLGDAGLYAFEGNWGDAAWAMAGIVPGGKALAKAAKAAQRARQLERAAAQSGGKVLRSRTSWRKMQDQVERKQAPKSVDRVCEGRGPFEKDHVHFGRDEKHALNFDGTWKHGGRPLTNAEADWITGHGWTLPK
jgi:hypothetical protein